MPRGSRVFRLTLQPLFQNGLLVLIAGLAQQGEHVLFIAFHPRLVEGVYPQQIAGNGAGFLEEVDDLAQGVLGKVRGVKEDVRHAPVAVGQNRALHCLLVDEGHGAAFQIVKAVHIGRVVAQGDLVLGLVNKHHGFKQLPAAVLDILAHGVQVCGEHHAGREQALLVLALALAI